MGTGISKKKRMVSSVQERISAPKEPSITIIHFNDVYNVEEQPSEPLAGAARFKPAVQSFKERDPLVLFSGDILAPSIMSTFTHGEQMIEVMNQIGVHCSVYGIHDFDFGLDRLIEVAEQTNCGPWLMSNVIDNETERPLAEGVPSKIFRWHGWNIGIVGLVEKEWLDTLSTINPDEVTFYDYIERGRELATNLKNEGCDYIIALTHMRTPNDIRLAENVDEIDLILGGHDHVYESLEINGKQILKSGTDFRDFSVLTLEDLDGKISLHIERIEVTSKYPPDGELQEALEKYESVVNSKMDEVLGNFSVDLDGRFSSIRTQETNLGDFICDIMLACCSGDVAILNSGTLRSDRVHPKGEFKMRDLMTILPMLDNLTVLEVSGKQLLDALENGVSQYPKLEGRFPQVSGVSFAFNPSQPAGSRVYREIVKIGDEYVDPDAKYRCVCKSYMSSGRDGYTMLVDCPVLQDEEQCPLLSTSIQNHFKAIQSKLGKGKRRNSTHRQSLVLLSRKHSLIRSDDEPLLFRKLGRSASIDSALPSDRTFLPRQDSLQGLELEACKLDPKIDGRIICTEDENVIEKLLQQKISDMTIEEEAGKERLKKFVNEFSREFRSTLQRKIKTGEKSLSD